MAGIPLPQMNIGAPPPQVVTAKRPEIAGDEPSTAYKVGAGLRDIIGKGADAMSDFGNTNPRAAKLVAGAVATPVIDAGKGLLGMSNTPTADAPADTAATPAPAAAPPAANPASKVKMDLPTIQVPDSGTIGGGAQPEAAPAQAAPSPEQYPTTPPQSTAQYLPQLMAAAASQESAPTIDRTATLNPFASGNGFSWNDLFNASHQKRAQEQANNASIAAFNAGTQRRQADTGVLSALVEPVKADAANQTQLATTGMTANTSRADTAATNAAHLAAAKYAGMARLQSAQELAAARRYGADKSMEGKGSAVHYATSLNGSVVASQLNKDGQLVTHVIDPQQAYVHQQADRAAMAANDGDEIIIPGGKGIVKITNGVRRVYDKKTGKDIGWTPPARFSAVGMPPAGGGSGGAAADEISEALNN